MGDFGNWSGSCEGFARIHDIAEGRVQPDKLDIWAGRDVAAQEEREGMARVAVANAISRAEFEAAWTCKWGHRLEAVESTLTPRDRREIEAALTTLRKYLE